MSNVVNVTLGTIISHYFFLVPILGSIDQRSQVFFFLFDSQSMEIHTNDHRYEKQACLTLAAAALTYTFITMGLILCFYLLQEEVTRGHMVRLLKDAGADVNMKDRSGKTPLIHACEQRCNDVVKILIQHANICPDVEDMDGEICCYCFCFCFSTSFHESSSCSMPISIDGYGSPSQTITSLESIFI